MAGKAVEFRLNTTGKDARWMRGKALSESVAIDANDVRQAIVSAMQPGLVALKTNVSQARAITGRLRRSPGIVTRKYGGSKRLVIVGLVGYMSGVAPHSTYIEMGTPPRAGRGQIKARRYAWLAYFHNRQAMQDAAKANLEAVMAKAVSKAAS